MRPAVIRPGKDHDNVFDPAILERVSQRVGDPALFGKDKIGEAMFKVAAWDATMAEAANIMLGGVVSASDVAKNPMRPETIAHRPRRRTLIGSIRRAAQGEPDASPD